MWNRRTYAVKEMKDYEYMTPFARDKNKSTRSKAASVVTLVINLYFIYVTVISTITLLLLIFKVYILIYTPCFRELSRWA